MENQTQLQLTIQEELINKLKVATTDAQMITQSFLEVVTRIRDIDYESREFYNSPDLSITEEKCAEAKKIRLKYVKARTRGDEIHKELKAGLLLRAKAIDGAKNIIKLELVEREEKLEKIEKYYENLEKERKQKLAQKRSEQLAEYEINGAMFDLVNLGDEAFTMLLENGKQAYELKKQREKEAEEARIKAEIEQAKENQRIREENLKLKEQAEKQRLIDEQNRIKAQKEADRLAKIEAKRQAELRRQKEENEKLQAELKAKEEAEAKRIKDIEDQRKADELKRLQEEKKARMAPDKDKLRVMYALLVETTQAIEGNYTFSTNEYKNIKEKTVSELKTMLQGIAKSVANLE